MAHLSIFPQRRPTLTRLTPTPTPTLADIIAGITAGAPPVTPIPSTALTLARPTGLPSAITQPTVTPTPSILPTPSTALVSLTQQQQQRALVTGQAQPVVPTLAPPTVEQPQPTPLTTIPGAVTFLTGQQPTITQQQAISDISEEQALLPQAPAVQALGEAGFTSQQLAAQARVRERETAFSELSPLGRAFSSAGFLSAANQILGAFLPQGSFAQRLNVATAGVLESTQFGRAAQKAAAGLQITQQDLVGLSPGQQDLLLRRQAEEQQVRAARVEAAAPPTDIEVARLAQVRAATKLTGVRTTALLKDLKKIDVEVPGGFSVDDARIFDRLREGAIFDAGLAQPEGLIQFDSTGKITSIGGKDPTVFARDFRDALLRRLQGEGITRLVRPDVFNALLREIPLSSDPALQREFQEAVEALPIIGGATGAAAISRPTQRAPIVEEGAAPAEAGAPVKEEGERQPRLFKSSAERRTVRENEARADATDGDVQTFPNGDVRRFDALQGRWLTIQQ